jgi:hypothetical protein
MLEPGPGVPEDLLDHLGHGIVAIGGQFRLLRPPGEGRALIRGAGVEPLLEQAALGEGDLGDRLRLGFGFGNRLRLGIGGHGPLGHQILQHGLEARGVQAGQEGQVLDPKEAVQPGQQESLPGVQG